LNSSAHDAGCGAASIESRGTTNEAVSNESGRQASSSSTASRNYHTSGGRHLNCDTSTSLQKSKNTHTTLADPSGTRNE
jgi:hypothetical protein